jgi:hypothetical protein
MLADQYTHDDLPIPDEMFADVVNLMIPIRKQSTRRSDCSAGWTSKSGKAHVSLSGCAAAKITRKRGPLHRGTRS